MTDLTKIDALVQGELKAANEAHPLFASDHEAYAVILEEVQESRDEMLQVIEHCNQLWDLVREDFKDTVKIDKYKDIKGYALRTIQELIQVAAMADKAIMSKEKNGNENICN